MIDHISFNNLDNNCFNFNIFKLCVFFQLKMTIGTSLQRLTLGTLKIVGLHNGNFFLKFNVVKNGRANPPPPQNLGGNSIFCYCPSEFLAVVKLHLALDGDTAMKSFSSFSG